MPSVFIVGAGGAYENMFKSFGFDIGLDLSSANLVCFTGGEDVSPEYYNQAKHPSTHSNPDRDRREAYIFERAERCGIPLVGICRGAQFLNVMNEGEMYQNVTGHTGSHLMHDVVHNTAYMVTSTHHQMMMPTQKAEIIGYSNHKCDREWMMGGQEQCDTVDFGYEVVFYRDTKSLCYQPHPEMDLRSPMRENFRSLIKNLLNV